MRDTDLCWQILGLYALWFTDHVELDVAKGERTPASSSSQISTRPGALGSCCNAEILI